jgi:hypothetical protein
MLGDGDAPAAPLTRGGFPQPAAKQSMTKEMPWRYLVVCDIIPNTPPTTVLLVSNEGFVWRPLALHLAIRIDPGVNDEV